MRKYMLFNPMSGPPWEYPAIKSKELIIPLKKIVYKTSKYSLLKGDSYINISTLSAEINIVESPFTEDIYLIYSYAYLDGIPTKPVKMKVIRQSNDKIELIGIEHNIDISFSDYGMTIKINGNRISQIIYHNFEREFDYEIDGSINSSSRYDKNQLEKDIPNHIEDAVLSFHGDKYKTLLEYLVAKYPNYYKIYYIIGVLVRNTYYFDEATKLNKKFADAYNFKLALLKGENVEKERYETLKHIIKYRRHLSPLSMISFPIRYLELAEIEKQFGNSKKSWKYLSKYFSISRGHIPDAYYLRSSLLFEMKKYNKALNDINENLKQEKNSNYYLLRAQIKEAIGDIDGSHVDKKEAKNIEDNKSDVEVWF